jgi:hypothetical protein
VFVLISSLFFVGPATVISSSVVQSPANFPAKITSRTQINTAGDFPVFHYKLKLRSAQDWTGFVKAAAAESESVGAGCRVYLTLPRPADVTMTRPYVFAVFVWFGGDSCFQFLEYAQPSRFVSRYTSIHADTRARTV